jgi:5S rRNA maturation endonuclease (ribonuclease M5)
MKTKEINHEYKREFIIFTYIDKAGNLIKQKYIGYKLPEAKKLFKQYLKNL